MISVKQGKITITSHDAPLYKFLTLLQYQFFFIMTGHTHIYGQKLDRVL